MNFDNNFLKEVLLSYNNVLLSNGTGKSFNRSPKKVDNLHYRIASDLNREFINANMSQKYLAQCKETNKKEIKVHGVYYIKKADVAIIDKSQKISRIVGVIELKFVLSSLYKNISNYFEQSMGECVNIKMKGYKYYDVNIYLSNTPSYSKNNIISSVDVINSNKFNNYLVRSNIDSMQDPNKVTVPNKSLFMIIKNECPLKNENKDAFILRELNFLKKPNFNKLYDDNLINSNWGKNSFINQYSEFILQVKNDILKGEK